ncbi:MAG: sensor histidine kinase, partial [Thermoanaerobaculia bacterium]
MTNYTIAQKLKTPIVIVTESGSIAWRNEAFEQTFGTDAPRWLTEGARAVAGESGWLQGFFVVADEQRTIDVEIEGRTYRVERILELEDYGEPTVALWLEDVTAQREMEQAKSDFTSMIVHDLRGPLSGIQGTLEFVLSQEGNKIDALYIDLLQEAQRESERMMALINELLDFSKIESGNFTVEEEPIRMAGILKRAVRSLQSVASRDEIFLLSAHGRDVPQIVGSVEKLTQAIINLISNSLKFTPKKGLISVGAQIVRNGEVPEAIVVTVTDSGMGIKANEIQQIWEKYKQTRNKSLRGGGGTGLGLYIVKQIVEAHG